MVDTLGLPNIFFTHSAADLQRLELARLICPDNPDSKTARAKAVIENPALSDWFFYHRVMEFRKAFYTYIGVLGAIDYWLRLSSSTEVALMCMVWPGYQTHQTWSSLVMVTVRSTQARDCQNC